MWNFFHRRRESQAEKAEPVAATVCRVTWQYQHPPEALARSTEACSRAFARWLIEIEWTYEQGIHDYYETAPYWSSVV